MNKILTHFLLKSINFPAVSQDKPSEITQSNHATGETASGFHYDQYLDSDQDLQGNCNK